MQPPSRQEHWIIRILLIFGVFSILNFGYWFFQPEYLGHPILYGMLCMVIGYGILRHLYLWYHYAAIRIPDTPENTPDFSVDVLTTYVPGEPIEMLEETLRAIKNIRYPHTSYLCDEGDDTYLRSLCMELGVRHITRDTRKDAKAGNINNALRQASGEICLILDPDHVPQPDILDHILPHFTDSRVGFVQIVQSYFNKRNSLIARGAAEQTYQFYGPMMMSMNSYGTVNAIGANCTFRRKALDSIAGHAPGLAEDMHTAMQLFAKGWKSVYVPRVLARGLVPETLLTHFKQQLKWSRGTFELLFRVYPRLFRKFTWRQKLHFGILPLHFMVGLIYLLSFCIPLGSLLFSISPWTGNILLFLLAVFPLALSTLLIRAYIQKWVIEPDERGFHLVGGLLQIATWWIHFQGFVYALINKNVPYLPTEKKESQVTNLRIVIPNILVGLISIFAIFYGLSQDLTPFSVMMAGFAALNACFMFFSLYLATGITNENRILRDRFPRFTHSVGRPFMARYRKFSNLLFIWTRRMALPTILLGTLLTTYSLDRYLFSQWEGIIPEVPQPPKGPYYTGIFYPANPGGLTDIMAVDTLETRLDHDFDLISLYLAWGDGPSNQVPKRQIENIYHSGYWPMITWEPWMNDFRAADSIPEIQENRQVFEKILSGSFDAYIDGIAVQLKSFAAPVFLRFAHEFDNPAYPWSETGGNSPEEFVDAWRYVQDRFTKLGAYNVIWMWNPFKSTNIESYFPGEAYVDWIGVTSLNYGTLNQDGKWHTFHGLYEPFEEAFKKLPDLPVMLAEFGTLDLGGDKEAWLSDALLYAKKRYPAIKAWIFFYSKWDRNIPPGADYPNTYLDWTSSLEPIQKLPGSASKNNYPSDQILVTDKGIPYTTLPLPKKPLHGVHYKKGQRWFSSHYILNRPTLEKDFRDMKQAGVNTLRIQDPGVYTHNLLHISEEADLQLIYSFHIPDTLDFLTDQAMLSTVQESILKTVDLNKDHPHITAWNLGNPVWSRLRKSYARPVLDQQRHAFLTWFSGLCREIKKRDPNRLLFADLEPSQGTEVFVHRLKDRGIPLDALGLILRDSTDGTYFRKILNRHPMPYYLADVRVTDMGLLSGPHVIIRSWQDQWEANNVTFDGLVNHRGQRKRSYYELASRWAGMPMSDVSGSISVLRPAIPLYQGNKVTYYAKRYEEGSWRDPTEEEGADFEWFLVKRGYFEEPLGLKALGNGSRLELKIPEEYKFYQLLLTYRESGTNHPVISVRKTLNLPLFYTD